MKEKKSIYKISLENHYYILINILYIFNLFTIIYMKTVVITSWYFNPIHPGHIECFELCKDLWDELWVIVNNDRQVKIKTEQPIVFQDENFRSKIVSSLKVVDSVILAIDDDSTVCKSIEYVAKQIRQKYWDDSKIIFWKWGDRFANNIPEVEACKNNNIEIKDGLGKKIDSSSTYRNKD